MSILRSKESDVDLPEISLVDYVFEENESHEEKTAITDDATAEEISFGCLKTKVDQLACALYARGLRKGDVVCLFAEKSILGTVALLAIMKIGAVMSPCRPSHTAKELMSQLKSTESKAVIADEALIQTAKTAVEGCPFAPVLYCIGTSSGNENLDQMIKDTEKQESLPEIKIDPKKDVASIIFSSGTTGLPKGVMLTHFNLVADSAIYGVHLDNESGNIFFHSAPPFHIGALVTIVPVLHSGNTLILISSSDLIPYLLRAKHYQVTSLLLLPNNLLELCKLPSEEIDKLGIDFSQLTLVTGGSIFTASNTREVLAKTGAKAVAQGYGSTEAGIVATDEDTDNCVPGSTGVVPRNTQVKIVDQNSGNTLGPHETGEICIKGPGVTIGYLNNPEATQEVFDEEGWFHMGDLGYHDETGHIFVVDRIKDVIKYKSMQVSPTEIEDVIYTHPAVKLACVVSVEDDSAGEVPLACIILKDGHSATEQELTKLVADNLADYKHLRGGVRFWKEFPLTGVGKIIRREVRDQARAELQKQK